MYPCLLDWPVKLLATPGAKQSMDKYLFRPEFYCWHLEALKAPSVLARENQGTRRNTGEDKRNSVRRGQKL